MIKLKHNKTDFIEIKQGIFNINHIVRLCKEVYYTEFKYYLYITSVLSTSSSSSLCRWEITEEEYNKIKRIIL